MLTSYLFTLLTGCTGVETPPQPGIVSAIVDPQRSTHFFDLPFPSNDMLDDSMHVDLSGFPETPSEITREVIGGWARRISKTSQGFANHGAAYFRFDGPLEIPTVLTGVAEDPVLLIDVETGEQIPLALRFTTDAKDDPFLANNLLAMAPALGHPPASGATLVAVVMESAGAQAAEGWAPSDTVQNALLLAGVTGTPAVATTFTIQDTTGELLALFTDVDERLGDTPDWGGVNWKRMTHLDFQQGQTESGEDATRVTATFEDGSTDLVNMYANPDGEHAHDLMDWPMAVYQAEIPILNYSGLDNRPYMSPGLSHLFDTNEESGWIEFDGDMLTSVPEQEMMRIILSVPKDEAGAPRTDVPLVIYDHGTGGSAIHSVQRVNKHDQGREVAQRFADAGWAVIGRDAPLYGSRFDLTDEGFSGGSLGFYNVVNLPAFRDNQRQTAVDGHTLLRFIQTGLNPSLSGGSIDTTRIRRMGHSLGSLTSNLGVAPEPEAYESVLLSGTGGVLSHYFLDTGLIDDLGDGVVGQIFTLFQVDPPDPITAPAVLGAAIGLSEEAWENIDRLHPTITLFQWTMDPSDPMSVARDENLPATVLIGIGDHQVPNFTSHALATALPNATVVSVEATWDYDPHVVLHREVPGFDALSAWLND
jgi:hypothetical protein